MVAIAFLVAKAARKSIVVMILRQPKESELPIDDLVDRRLSGSTPSNRTAWLHHAIRFHAQRVKLGKVGPCSARCSVGSTWRPTHPRKHE